MSLLNNEILISSSVEIVWSILTDLVLLEKYDPTVKKSTLISKDKTGIGAKRKVEMLDDKNWFEEVLTIFEPNKALTYQLTNCSFPIKGLKHSYSFEKIENQIKVNQIMEYTVKFGLLGKLLDTLMIRKQTEKGIKQFFVGLKNFAESS